MNEDTDLHWFAMRAFRRKGTKLKEEIEKKGIRTYMAPHVMPSLLFVHCTSGWIQEFKRLHFSEVMIYRDSERTAPEPIPDKEMDMFMLVTSAGGDVEYIGIPTPEYLEGDRVRVIEGIYKGSEGVIKRIRRDRKLLVAVTGVAVLAISHLPAEYLEKID